MNVDQAKEKRASLLLIYCAVKLHAARTFA